MGTTAILPFMMFFSFLFLNSQSIDTKSINCSTKGLAINSPFSLQDQNCSYPNFKLTCQKNQTIIHFPSYGDLVVKSLSYDTKRLNLLDPKNCVHEVFLNLDLSSTPFDYYYVLKSYTYVNCSYKLASKFDEVPCLSGKNYHVYVVGSVESLPRFCRAVKTKGIPFSYSPYLSDNSFGLGFTWDLNGYEDCDVRGNCFNPSIGKVVGFILIMLVAAILLSLNTFYSKVAWDYSLANVNDVTGQKNTNYFPNENAGYDKKIASV